MDGEWKNVRPKVEIPEEALKIILEHEDDSISNRLLATGKRSPFLVAALVGIVTVCGIGAYKWKSRKIPMQMFLIQLRVAAQGTAIGCLSIGMMYQLYKELTKKKE